jgi:outer membrane protein
MYRNGWIALAAAALASLGTAVSAADRPASPDRPAAPSPPSFYLHLGPAGVFLAEDAKMSAFGQPVVGATISIKSQLTFVVEAGYFVTPNVAVSFTGGLPPVAKIEAAGTMNGLGKVGATTYGPMTLTAHYHFTEFGRVQPYIGAGPAFMYVFDDEDGLLSDLKVQHTVGVAFQAGVDLMLDEHWGAFVDFKKAILRTKAVGFLGPAPVKADVTLDPAVINAGVTYRF